MSSSSPSRTRRLVRSLRPPSRLAGRLAVQNLLFALGDGIFMTGSLVFFTEVVGLTFTQVGLGLTLGGVAAFVAALPMGRLVDRFGPKRMWALSAAGQAATFALWPFIDDFAGYLAMAITMEVLGALGGAAHGAYTIDVLPAAERVISRAYMYSALNAGFTLGALLGGVALAAESNDLVRAIPWVTAVVFAVNCAFILRLPNASHDDRTPEERKVKVPGPGPLRNPGWLGVGFFGGVLWTNQVLLHLVIPAWLLGQTDAPRALVAVLLGTNTVMCILLPMAAARGIHDITTGLRGIRISAGWFVLACVITILTHSTVGWATIALLLLGHVALTGAELYLSAASWSFEADLMDPRRRGEYQGVSELTGTLGRVWAPAAYMFLAMSWGTGGWLVIALVILVASLGIHPSARAAERFLARHGPGPDEQLPVPDADPGVVPAPLLTRPEASPLGQSD
ncbi:MFS transporter [Nocardioides campestrisoli]|uniref:MFS transporter n=1 Tax=Nocardioides campestrisoli TaxID=2736757 RepID=UPI00281166DF|nr:MFS transporter [Nocardioides campestrisoli]